MSGLAALLIVWVLVKVPDYPGQAGHERRSMGTVFHTPGVRPVLATVILWMLGHNVLYTFIAPFIALAGLAGNIDTVLMTFGLAALAGIWGAGRMVDRQLRVAVLSSLAIFALLSLLFIYASSAPAAIYLGVTVWGLTFGGAATLLQTALADSAGDGADVALSMNVVAWNSAIAGAGVLGGVLLNNWGAGSFPWAVLGLTVAGFVVVWLARVHGFPAGPRVQQ
jgi:predicted MFS family arabinose efflux permease